MVYSNIPATKENRCEKLHNINNRTLTQRYEMSLNLNNRGRNLRPNKPCMNNITTISLIMTNR